MNAIVFGVRTATLLRKQFPSLVTADHQIRLEKREAGTMPEFMEQTRPKQLMALRLILVVCGAGIVKFAAARLKVDGVTLEELLDEAERRLHANKARHEAFQKFAKTADVMTASRY